MESAGRGPRVGRAAAGTGLGVLVALAAHLAGGGTAPSIGAVLVVAVLVQPLAVLVAGRRHRLHRQAVLVALGQAGVHLLLALGPAARPATGSTAPGMPGMHDMTAMPALVAATPHPGGPMLGLHVLAWVLTVAAWRWGAGAAARALAAVGRTAARLRPLPLVAPSAAPSVAAVGAPPALRTLLLLAAAPRRGPPRAA